MAQSKLFGGKEKKPLTKNQQIVKTVFDWTFNVICLALVIFALLMAIASISRTAGQEEKGIGISALGNITYAPVATKSMEPTILAGDLAVGRKYDSAKYTLKEGDVITFRTTINGQPALNTHRIVEIVYNDAEKTKIGYVRTKGDNSPDIDSSVVMANDILSVFKTTYKGVGKPIIWLQSDPQHFFLGVVLPIIILFVIYAVIFIRAIINAALGKKRLEAATVDGLSEEDKKRLAEEYLAQLEKEKQEKENTELDSETADKDSSSEK